jgi:protein-S-isoprenylcysteine O-methyltransferase Ste14
LIVVAQAQMGASWRIGIDRAPTGLVTAGLFRHIRHPIYSGLFALLVALVLLTPSPWTIMGAAWLGSLIAIQARLEERHLEAVHGSAFRVWAARTGRFLPAIGRLAAP